MNRSRLVSVGQAVARGWPALAVATVAASVPLVSFAASPTSFPDGIIAGRSVFTNGLLVSSPSAGGQGIAVTGAAVGVRANSSGGTAINATNGQFHNVIGVDASGDALGVRVNATG